MFIAIVVLTGEQSDELVRTNIICFVILGDMQSSLQYVDQNKNIQVRFGWINPSSVMSFPLMIK